MAQLIFNLTIFKGMKQCAKIGALARVHAENGHIIAEKQKEILKLGITVSSNHLS